MKTQQRVPVSQPCPTVSRTHPKLPIRDRVPVSLPIGHGHGTRVMEPKDTSLRRPSVPPKKRGAQPGESTDKNIKPCRDKLMAGYDS